MPGRRNLSGDALLERQRVERNEKRRQRAEKYEREGRVDLARKARAAIDDDAPAEYAPRVCRVHL